MYLSITTTHCIHVLLPNNLDSALWRDLIIARKAKLLKAGINYGDFSNNITQNSANTYFILIRKTPHAERKGRKLCLSKKNGILKNVILAVSAVNEALSLGTG